MATYTLPDLPYDYGALEPNIIGRIMELHHDKHHAAYVNGANSTLDALGEARDKDDFGKINMLEQNLAFHVSGHRLHSLFWECLSPEGGDKPDGDLATQIEKDFGGFNAFQSQFNAVFGGVQGSGWAVLAYEPLADQLVIQQVHDHQGRVTQGGVPVLCLDAWEHAWYLQYENRKAEFAQAFWNIVNWDTVAKNLSEAKS